MDLTTATPAQIDTEIAELDTRRSTVLDTIDRANRTIRDAEGYRTIGQAQYADEVIAAQRETIATCQAKLDELEEQAVPLRMEYAAKRWTRVYLVDNSNGHVHTTTACSTTHVTTRFVWITAMSGSTPDQIVEQAGARTCLRCFPGVRAEILAGRPCLIETPERQAAREKRAAEKATRAAAKAAKAITNPDGSPLRIASSCGVITTLHTARQEYVDAAANVRYWEGKHASALENPQVEAGRPGWTARCESNAATSRADAEVLLAAIAHKQGVDVEAMRAELAPRVAKRVRDTC